MVNKLNDIHPFKKHKDNTTQDPKILKLWADSGANVHVVNIPTSHFDNLQPITLRINTASNKVIECTWKGSIGPLDNIYQSDSVRTNLLSVSQLCHDHQCVTLFTASEVMVFKHQSIQLTGPIIWKGKVNNGMYLLEIPIKPGSTTHAYANVVDALIVNNYTNWHRRLNHPSKEYMIILKRLNPNSMEWTKDEEIGHHSKTCLGCVRGKLTQKSHYTLSRGLANVTYNITCPGELILVDMYFSNTPSRDNHYVGLIIVDAFSKCIFTLTSKTKQEAGNLFSQWIDECAQLKVNIKAFATVRSDNGGEFIGNDFQQVVIHKNIMHERTPPYSHVNKAERAIRHLKENTRSLIEENKENLSRAALHLTSGHSYNAYIFWSDAASHVCKVANTMNYGKHQVSKQFKFYKREIVDITRLKVFGSPIHVHVNVQGRQTWEPTSREGIYLGVDSHSPRSYI